MNRARNLKANREYNAFQVQAMTPLKRKELKDHWVCIKCNQKASFNKKSVDGKVPCFSAKHKLNCDMGSASSKKKKVEDDREEVSIVEVDLSKFEICFKDYFKEAIEDSENDEDNKNEKVRKGRSRRKYINEPKKIVKKRLTLRQILEYALRSELEEIPLFIDGKEVKCYRWDNITNQKEGEEGLFFGYLISMGKGGWLNSSWENKDFSIKLSKDITKILTQKIGKIEGKFKVQVPAIVYGKLKISKSLNKPYLEVVDTTKVYIHKSIYNKNFIR